MSWPVVILFAVSAALLAFAALMIPAFDHSSVRRIGETVEAWIFFAVIIMANCKKPLESALKTFVFFLISQPLIYLLQVPFSWMGWGLFQYYKHWFILTLCTFPAAFAGWYIKKKNWLSLLILLPVLGLLTFYYVDGFQTAFRHFPRLLLMAVFCLAQVLLYLYTFTEKLWQKLVGFFVPLAVVLIIVFTKTSGEMSFTDFLPDNPTLSENAVVTVDDDNTKIVITENSDESMIRVQTNHFGAIPFEIKDGDRTYRYDMEIYEGDDGSTKVRITPK
nr:hypothetical protein [uncultured Ruminococcus sp.]